MPFFRRHLSSLLRWACWLAVLATVMPTLSGLRHAAEASPSYLWTEVCSAAGHAADWASSSSDEALPAASGSHCPLCVTMALAAPWPEPDRRADFAPAPHRLRPAAEPLKPPRPAPVWRLEPSRAPPALA